MQLTVVDSRDFRSTCAKFATGVAIATATGKNSEPVGLTINSFTSVSCAPPMVLICVDYRCSFLPQFRGSAFFGVNMLEEGQRELSVRFSTPDVDRFAGVDWHQGETGVPVLAGALAQMECCITQTMEAGDHAIFLGEVVRATCRPGRPLIYFASGYRALAEYESHF